MFSADNNNKNNWFSVKDKEKCEKKKEIKTNKIDRRNLLKVERKL